MTLNVARKLSRPKLTLPTAEAEWLRDAYECAGSILEYGSGGSTVMASEMVGKSIHSVESDREWAEMMTGWFSQNSTLSNPVIHHTDIGPTREWGMPDDDKRWRAFPKYPLEIWDQPTFVHPDVVLIDGRFRVGCLLAVLIRAKKPVEVYFDDYVGREPYHATESFVKPTEIRGRMARFDINPTPFPSERLLEIIQLMTRPR
jgi:hypothetical protein